MQGTGIGPVRTKKRQRKGESKQDQEKTAKTTLHSTPVTTDGYSGLSLLGNLALEPPFVGFAVLRI